MLRESTIETAVCAHARLLGWLVYKFVSPNQRGVPDRMFLKDGNVIFIEFKATGKQLTPLQRFKITEIIAAGFDVHVIDDIELGKSLFY
jgi:hypothetical protein